MRRKKIVLIAIVFVLVSLLTFYKIFNKQNCTLNLLDMTSVLNTHDYELMANNPQDISSDFLFVIKSNNEKEQKKQEAFGWLKKDNYIIFSALAQLQNIKQNIDFTLSLEFENNEDVFVRAGD